MSRSRAWCFTLNNPAVVHIEHLMKEEVLEKVKYLVYEPETAPGTGTKHLQGYVYFNNALTLKGVQKWFPSGAHWEVAKGSAAENRKYCTKENPDKAVEYGEIPAQGQRNDIDLVRGIIKAGGGMAEICEQATGYQALRMGELLLKYEKPKAREPPRVLWFWGPTGTGKTRTAIEMGGEDYWISGRDLRWWDGYTGQKTVIIDDFRKGACKFEELLRILDRYPYRVEVKGGSTWLKATTIIVTAPFEPEIYSPGVEDTKQLLRRISEVRKFSTEVAGNTAAATSVDSEAVVVGSVLPPS